MLCEACLRDGLKLESSLSFFSPRTMLILKESVHGRPQRCLLPISSLHSSSVVIFWWWNNILEFWIWLKIISRTQKRSTEKNQTNATCAIMRPLGHSIWGHIWKCTVEKSQTNATSVTMHPLEQTIWGNILKYTVEKSQTNATNVTLLLLKQAI